jgi:hypothetical protein
MAEIHATTASGATPTITAEGNDPAYDDYWRFSGNYNLLTYDSDGLSEQVIITITASSPYAEDSTIEITLNPHNTIEDFDSTASTVSYGTSSTVFATSVSGAPVTYTAEGDDPTYDEYWSFTTNVLTGELDGLSEQVIITITAHSEYAEDSTIEITLNPHNTIEDFESNKYNVPQGESAQVTASSVSGAPVTFTAVGSDPTWNDSWIFNPDTGTLKYSGTQITGTNVIVTVTAHSLYAEDSTIEITLLAAV